MKKCSRCNTYFGNGQMDLVCSFHAYPWLDLHAPGKGLARIGVWSCCKEITRDAPGCVKAKHIEDKITSENLRKFEVIAVKGTTSEAFELLDSEFLQQNLGSTHIHFMDHSYSSLLSSLQNQHANQNANQNKTSGNQNKKETTPEKPAEEGYIKHTIQLTDTLPGIALRYKTTVATLKQINNFFSNNDLYKLRTLLVPDPINPPHFSHSSPSSSSSLPLTPQQQTKQVNKLSVVENICKEEALFYLSDNNWSLLQARESFADDVAWAAEEWSRLHGKGKFKEWLGDGDVQTVAVVACGALIVLLCVLL